VWACRNSGAIGLILLLGACASSASIWSAVAPGADPGTYATFEPIDPTPPPGGNSVIFEGARQLVEAEMLGKGYAKVAEAEMLPILSLSAKDRLEVHRWDGAGCWDWRCWPSVEVYRYTEATIAVDLFDTQTGRALWRGQAVIIVDQISPDPQAYEVAVRRLMAQLPVSTAPLRAHTSASAVAQDGLLRLVR
jgi:hypothetical protein